MESRIVSGRCPQRHDDKIFNINLITRWLALQTAARQLIPNFNKEHVRQSIRSSVPLENNCASRLFVQFFAASALIFDILPHYSPLYRRCLLLLRFIRAVRRSNSKLKTFSSFLIRKHWPPVDKKKKNKSWRIL